VEQLQRHVVWSIVAQLWQIAAHDDHGQFWPTDRHLLLHSFFEHQPAPV